MQKSGKFPEVILNLSWAILKWIKIQEGQLDILNKGRGVGGTIFSEKPQWVQILRQTAFF